jgi:hypothetical protein
MNKKNLGNMRTKAVHGSGTKQETIGLVIEKTQARRLNKKLKKYIRSTSVNPVNITVFRSNFNEDGHHTIVAYKE